MITLRFIIYLLIAVSLLGCGTLKYVGTAEHGQQFNNKLVYEVPLLDFNAIRNR